MPDRPRILMASPRGEALAPLRAALPRSFEIFEADTVERTLERARACGADLLLLDLSMSEAHCNLLRVLGSSRGEEAVPILAIANDRAEALAALRSGAADALCTPIDAEEAAARIEVLLRGKRAQDRLRERAAQLERLALTDGLTALGNRRLFDARLRQELSRAQRFRDPLALLLVDLDHFKKVNDSYGHLVGDEVLCAASAALAASVRSIDVVCRFGGEEFALLLPRTPLAGSLAVAQRVCHAVSQVRVSGHEALRITASVGVAAFPGEDVQGEQDLLRACDSALYRAKRSGRNCVCTWPAEDAFVLPPTRPGDGARA